jgi:hypothetical protein
MYTDMDITVGHIMSNPNFDTNCDIVIFEDDGDMEPVLYESDGLDHQNSNYIPVDVLAMTITYITIRNNKLALGVR